MATVHISFTPMELTKLDQMADRVGLSRTAFIRQMVFTGKIKGYNFKPLLNHSEAVGEVTAAVRDMIAKPHPYRWAYEADIERIEDLMNQLLESEQSLISDLTRRLKR